MTIERVTYALGLAADSTELEVNSVVKLPDGRILTIKSPDSVTLSDNSGEKVLEREAINKEDIKIPGRIPFLKSYQIKWYQEPKEEEKEPSSYKDPMELSKESPIGFYNPASPTNPVNWGIPGNPFSPWQ